MARPITPTPILKGKEATKFLNVIRKDCETPSGPTPTPKLQQAQKLVREHGQHRQEHIR